MNQKERRLSFMIFVNLKWCFKSKHLALFESPQKLKAFLKKLFLNSTYSKKSTLYGDRFK